jgi:hypothetical protein
MQGRRQPTTSGAEKAALKVRQTMAAQKIELTGDELESDGIPDTDAGMLGWSLMCLNIYMYEYLCL